MICINRQIRSMNPDFKPPVNFAGSKQRFASSIADLLPLSQLGKDGKFYDLCCGSGAVSLACVKYGLLKPRQIVMYDCGLWGDFWFLVSTGNFDLMRFGTLISMIPEDAQTQWKWLNELWLNELAEEKMSVYSFLILQAASVGGRPISNSSKTTSRHSFRPRFGTEDYPPFKPKPMSMFDRVLHICESMYGITAYKRNVNLIRKINGVAYIDPPYEAFTKTYGENMYGHKINTDKVIARLSASGPLVVSESRPLSGGKNGGYAVQITPKRERGFNRASNREEWVTIFSGRQVH